MLLVVRAGDYTRERLKQGLPHRPRPGQVWRDVREELDRHWPGKRDVRVLEVDETHAHVENVKTGRKTRIRADRFRATSSGYRLIDPGVAQGACDPLEVTELILCYGAKDAGASGSQHGLSHIQLHLGNGGRLTIEARPQMRAFYDPPR